MRAELRRLFFVYLALISLLGLTIIASFLPLGLLSPVSSFGIAAAKTALIAWFFMGLRIEAWPMRLALLVGFLWLTILLTLMLLDVTTRTWSTPLSTA